MPVPSNESPRASRLSGARGAVASLLLVLVSIVLCLGAIEAAFRMAPAILLPAGSYGAGVLNERLGMNVHGTPVLYTKAGFVRRVPNREGFLDVDHAIARPPGVLRVGLFGDSYVEAQQVPLEATFYRRAQARTGPSIEWLAFGMSGWGTLHALRAFEAFAPRYDLGVAVYLFVENDPGDNDLVIKTHAAEGGRSLPAAALSVDGTAWEERRAQPPGSEPVWFGAAKWAQRHSLLAHVVADRWAVLTRQGVQVRADRSQREMTRAARGIPNMNDLPSTWPPEARARVERLGALILRDWKRAADERHVDLLVLYVPRGDDQLRGAVPEAATWLPWLREACAGLDLPLVDPSPALREALDAGREVYADHWTPAGHEVIATVLEEAVRGRVRTACR